MGEAGTAIVAIALGALGAVLSLPVVALCWRPVARNAGNRLGKNIPGFVVLGEVFWLVIVVSFGAAIVPETSGGAGWFTALGFLVAWLLVGVAAMLMPRRDAPAPDSTPRPSRATTAPPSAAGSDETERGASVSFSARYAIDPRRAARAATSTLLSWHGAVGLMIAIVPLPCLGAALILARADAEEYLGVGLAVAAVAGVLVAALLFTSSRRSNERLMQARLERFNEEAGPIEVHLADEGMTQHSALGSETWPWSAYAAMIVVDGYALLARHGLIETVPLDAFGDARGAEALLARVVPRATPGEFRKAARSAV